MRRGSGRIRGKEEGVIASRESERKRETKGVGKQEEGRIRKEKKKKKKKEQETRRKTVAKKKENETKRKRKPGRSNKRSVNGRYGKCNEKRRKIEIDNERERNCEVRRKGKTREQW